MREDRENLLFGVPLETGSAQQSKPDHWRKEAALNVYHVMECRIHPDSSGVKGCAGEEGGVAKGNISIPSGTRPNLYPLIPDPCRPTGTEGGAP